VWRRANHGLREKDLHAPCTPFSTLSTSNYDSGLIIAGTPPHLQEVDDTLERADTVGRRSKRQKRIQSQVDDPSRISCSAPLGIQREIHSGRMAIGPIDVQQANNGVSCITVQSSYIAPTAPYNSQGLNSTTGVVNSYDGDEIPSK
jgi:hypothetical protein